MGPPVADKFQTGSNLPTGCLVQSIFTNWLGESFMYGPTLTSLVNPHSAIVNQQNIINNAAAKINAGSVSNYYSGSWTLLSLMVVNGDLAKIVSIVTGGAAQPVAPVPVASVPVAPKPVPVAPAPVASVPVATGSCANIKYGDVPTNNWYIVIAGATSTSSVSVKCPNNVQASCTWSATWGRHTCNPSAECIMPRSAVVNGATCALNPDIIARMEEDSTPTSIPAWGIALIVVGSLSAIVLILGAIFYFSRPEREERV
jgi:hypothetical protein